LTAFVELDAKKANSVVGMLEEHYKDVHYYLNFSTPIELLVAAILSAQTKDTKVNAITPRLFGKYKTAKDYADAKPAELMGYVGGVLYAKNKVANIIGACKEIDEKYRGKVPDRMEDLVELPGIGRKTANTILINAYGKVEGIPVDTWVIKLSYRIGLSKAKNADSIEKDLEAKISKQYWKNIAYVLKAHGKEVCGAVPKCSACPIKAHCPKNGVTESA
jgi:endonuclease III